MEVAEPVESRGAILREIAIASVAITALVTAASARMPERYVATTVGFLFLGATWVLVWRKDEPSRALGVFLASKLAEKLDRTKAPEA